MWPQGVRHEKGILGKLCRQGHNAIIREIRDSELFTGITTPKVSKSRILRWKLCAQQLDV